MGFTRREKHSLIIAAIIYLVISIAATIAPSKDGLNQFLADWEPVILIILVFPLGVYLANDPERANNNNE